MTTDKTLTFADSYPVHIMYESVVIRIYLNFIFVVLSPWFITDTDGKMRAERRGTNMAGDTPLLPPVTGNQPCRDEGSTLCSAVKTTKKKVLDRDK